jgi:hypothetical protein
MHRHILIPSLLLIISCNARPDPAGPAPASAPDPVPARAYFGGELPPYWYEGVAELTTYDLQQARYGELREGTAVLVQVSEDFLTDRQVKNDAYANPNSTPILKTNLFKRFTTGIYDYSLMSSVFTPTDATTQPRTLKVTTSVQDWCGQTFTQLNYAGGEVYGMELRSYFEREGDRTAELEIDFLEDEIFNRIRIGGELPEGEYRVLPATGYLLMTHQPYAAARATASLRSEGEERIYTLDFPELRRRLEVTFAAAAPHVIRRWSETYPSRGELLTTTATLKAQRREPYWKQNAVADEPRRAELGLE